MKRAIFFFIHFFLVGHICRWRVSTKREKTNKWWTLYPKGTILIKNETLLNKKKALWFGTTPYVTIIMEYENMNYQSQVKSCAMHRFTQHSHAALNFKQPFFILQCAQKSLFNAAKKGFFFSIQAFHGRWKMNNQICTKTTRHFQLDVSTFASVCNL